MFEWEPDLGARPFKFLKRGRAFLLDLREDIGIVQQDGPTIATELVFRIGL